MDGLQAIVSGSVIGILGSLPPAILFELALRKRRTASVAVGLASIMVSFAMFSCAIWVVWLVARDKLLYFGVSAVVSFMLVWVVEAVRAWRDAQRGAGQGERKRGEPTRESTRRD